MESDLNEQKPATSRRHLFGEVGYFFERRLLRRSAQATAATVAIAAVGCGGSGNNPTRISVWQWTINHFGAENVSHDGDYVTRVGGLIPQGDEEGLIFKINGSYPPDNSDFQDAFQHQVSESDEVSWSIVVRNRSRVGFHHDYLQKARSAVGGLQKLLS